MFELVRDEVFPFMKTLKRLKRLAKLEEKIAEGRVDLDGKLG